MKLIMLSIKKVAPLIKQTKENDIALFNKLINNIKSPELA